MISLFFFFKFDLVINLIWFCTNSNDFLFCNIFYYFSLFSLLKTLFKLISQHIYICMLINQLKCFKERYILTYISKNDMYHVYLLNYLFYRNMIAVHWLNFVMIGQYDTFELFIHMLYFYIAHELIIIISIFNCHL